jgi:hypothetical protein
MRVYGLDFTSSPQKDKPLTLAICYLENHQLLVENFHEFGSDGTKPLECYANWLEGQGEKWQSDKTWVAGLDFPFGMPVAAIARFGWGNLSDVTNWERYVRRLFSNHKSLTAFKADIKEWSYPNEMSETGNPIKIQPKRLTDQIARSQSPIKVTDNPYPGAMFYQGCKALLDSEVYIPRLRDKATDAEYRKIVVEAYPRLVAQKFIPINPDFSELVAKKTDLITEKKRTDKAEAETKKNLTKEIKTLSARAKIALRYKEAGTNEVVQGNRKKIIDELEKPDNPYQVRLSFKTEKQKTDCINDPKADLLDSVLCAVQAAWSYGMRENGFGIPRFEQHDLIRQQVALEGWIVDPAMMNVLGEVVA